MRSRKLIIENAVLFYKNFSGEVSDSNPYAYRSFCVYIDPDSVSQMEEDGWIVKFRKQRDPEDDPRPYIQVAVSYKVFSPTIIQLRDDLPPIRHDDESICTLDKSHFEKVDVNIYGSLQKRGGKQWLKAYLTSMVFKLSDRTTYRDELLEKYGFNTEEENNAEMDSEQ